MTMPNINYGEVISAADHDAVITINDTTNTIREFIRCGAIRTIDGQYVYFGGSDLLGNQAVSITGGS